MEKLLQSFPRITGKDLFSAALKDFTNRYPKKRCKRLL